MRLETVAAAALAFTPLALASNSFEQLHRLCGPKLHPCPLDMCCVAKPCFGTSASIGPCPGYCEFTNQYPSCGGFRIKPVNCPKGSSCMDDPRDPKSCGMACDAPGICVPDKAPFCGGIAGIRCPTGLFCYDDPRDGCDPSSGGADCGGICL